MPVTRPGAVGSSRQGWLAAVVPADADTFRVPDPVLAATLEDAGAKLTDGDADVEIVLPEEISGAARHVIVTIDAGQEEGRGFLVSAARRVAGSARARMRARAVRRLVADRGYPEVVTILWDIEQRVHLAGGREPIGGRRSSAEYFPQRALVVGAR